MFFFFWNHYLKTDGTSLLILFSFKDPNNISMKIIMEWFHQRLLKTMLAIGVWYHLQKKPNFSFSFIVIYKCINEMNKENKWNFPWNWMTTSFTDQNSYKKSKDPHKKKSSFFWNPQAFHLLLPIVSHSWAKFKVVLVRKPEWKFYYSMAKFQGSGFSFFWNTTIIWQILKVILYFSQYLSMLLPRKKGGSSRFYVSPLALPL